MAIDRSAIGLTTKDVEQEVGAQFRRLRIDAGLSQQQLAEKSGASLGALKNLESGAGVSLATIVAASRALGRVDWLFSVSPAPTIDPMAQLNATKTPRQRVFAPRRKL